MMTGGNGVGFEWREADGASTTNVGGDRIRSSAVAAAGPARRSAPRLRVYERDHWTLVKQVTIPMPVTVMWGWRTPVMTTGCFLLRRSSISRCRTIAVGRSGAHDTGQRLRNYGGRHPDPRCLDGFGRNVGVSRYRLYRNGSTTPVGTVPGNLTSYVDRGLSAGTSYTLHGQCG